jgi:hypothetical protein
MSRLSPQTHFFRAMARVPAIFAILLVLATSATAQSAAKGASQPVANFVDIAEKAGLTMKNVFGGLDTKKYIIETTGTGVAIFDYDNDGWPDIFFVNGTTLEDMKAGKSGPTNHLYHNNHDGTFTPRVGDRACASAITTTTVGKIYSLPTTAKTGCITTIMGSSSW